MIYYKHTHAPNNYIKTEHMAEFLWWVEEVGFAWIRLLEALKHMHLNCRYLLPFLVAFSLATEPFLTGSLNCD